MARSPDIAIGVGVAAVVLGATVNTAMKIIFARAFGSKDYFEKLTKVLIPPIIIGMVLVALL